KFRAQPRPLDRECGGWRGKATDAWRPRRIAAWRARLGLSRGAGHHYGLLVVARLLADRFSRNGRAASNKVSAGEFSLLPRRDGEDALSQGRRREPHRAPRRRASRRR